MFTKFLKSTEDLFDRKLKNGTIMVAIIASCVVMTGAVTHTSASLTANVLQASKAATSLQATSDQYIIIGWKKYRIVLEEVK